jgi:hypothetical protein
VHAPGRSLYTGSDMFMPLRLPMHTAQGMTLAHSSSCRQSWIWARMLCLPQQVPPPFGRPAGSPAPNPPPHPPRTLQISMHALPAWGMTTSPQIPAYLT